ncbi:protein of unassigned function [Methylobacterium oryzae CBMB20]|uniref:Protein of unassigned function n=2 Tax=Methylobacterium oryzae TaxID=334852 RepID=A0A089Q9Z5_9HYPH|nr:protein of unassigned function [Methylobacterium oryzae CBMB20]
MAGIMAHRRAADWGVTRHRYVHTFHLHHTAKIATEGEGLITEVHRSPVPQDAWHFGSGFLSGRSIPIITYHRRRGEYGRSVVPIDDAGDAEEAA